MNPALQSNLISFAESLEQLPVGVNVTDLMVGDMPLADALRRYAADYTMDRASRDQGPDGQTWVPLSPAYLHEKLRHGYPAKMSFREGLMMAPRQFHEAPMRVNGNSVEIGYGVTPFERMKMRWFHFGTRRQPARPLLGPDDGMREGLNAIIAVAVRQHLAAHVPGVVGPPPEAPPGPELSWFRRVAMNVKSFVVGAIRAVRG